LKLLKQNKLFLFFICLTYSFSQELEEKVIPLSGIITDPNQEISGLDWYKDNLVLLPENLNGFVFIIPKKKIIKSIELKNPPPIFPEVNSFKTPNYAKTIKGFEGFESIAFNNDKFFVTIEAKDDDGMKSYLAWGKINSNSLNMTIHKDSLKEIKTPIQVKNMTYESTLIYEENIILLYEANGKNLHSKITQPNISLLNHSISSIEFPNIEYRITDVTRLDINNKFWAINYFWPGDKKRLKPSKDLILTKHSEGASHRQSEIVERLVQFEIEEDKIISTDKKPIQLKLDKKSRNWEGIVQLEDKGFLIATDKYPKMILAFLEYKL
jgi:hypothetical protein